tara:strand:+ start:550 stop:696 length:147 start_codon:yes stop_codon:yes gene_type:complete
MRDLTAWKFVLWEQFVGFLFTNQNHGKCTGETTSFGENFGAMGKTTEI